MRPPERPAYIRSVRQSLDMAKHEGFGWEPGAYTWKRNGCTVRLRFSQDTQQWTAKTSIAGLDYKKFFRHTSPENINQWLIDWVDDLHGITPDPFSFDEIVFCIDCGYLARNCACGGSETEWTATLPHTAVRQAE